MNKQVCFWRNKKHLFRFWLVFIILGASFLRLYRLGSYPPLNADEAAIGYNAWSLIQTGKDEHGEAWPIHFKSFGDYKPGAYFYMVIPFVKTLGLNEWAVRLPSALMGILTVYLVFLLAKLLWQDEVLGLIWAFVLSVSPWHIHFSRGGWESNTAVFFIVLGVHLFFKSLQENRKFSIFNFQFSIILFILAMYTYHSARIIVPALVLGLIIFNWRILWQRRKTLILPIVIGILLLAPLAKSVFSGGASSRFSGVGLFSDSGPFWRTNELRGEHQNFNSLSVRLLHNKFLMYGISFWNKYFSHFNGQFLFIDGDEVPRSKVPDMGVMYLIEAGFLVLGVWFWLREKREFKYLPFLWMGVAPLASAMTFQAPSALRALMMVIPLTLFVARGIVTVVDRAAYFEFRILNIEPRGKRRFSKSIVLCSVFIILMIYSWSILYWQDRYFNHYLKRYPTAWPDFRPIIEQIKAIGDDYEKICIETKADQPYILALFYLRYPPEKIQREIELTPPDQFGFSTVEHFGKYYFGDCQKIINAKIVTNEEI